MSYRQLKRVLDMRKIKIVICIVIVRRNYTFFYPYAAFNTDQITFCIDGKIKCARHLPILY